MQTQSAYVIPAYNPGALLQAVLDELSAEQSRRGTNYPVVVVDDGCTDGSIQKLSNEGLQLLHHQSNQGKGAALRTAFLWAQSRGLSSVVTLDADGQHPASAAADLMACEASQEALVLAVRDLAGAGAPRANQLSNAFSNRVLSLFSGQRLQDTQCGLRRYPVELSLALGAVDSGYAFESDLVLRAAIRRLQIVHLPCAVIYPDEESRLSYFDSVRDPARMVFRVVKTSLTVPRKSLSLR